ncbi:TPA: TIGR00296 family protein, partial [bacterium]|nr:TIGR00296 family protein [bacterium]
VMPGRDGIIVSYRGRRGCYLPQVAVETGWSAEKFVMNCAREKAGIDRRDVEEGNATLEIFQADIFEEKK